MIIWLISVLTFYSFILGKTIWDHLNSMTLKPGINKSSIFWFNNILPLLSLNYYKFNLICGRYIVLISIFLIFLKSRFCLLQEIDGIYCETILYTCAKYKMKAQKNLVSLGTNHNERPRKLSQSVLPALYTKSLITFLVYSSTQGHRKV